MRRRNQDVFSAGEGIKPRFLQVWHFYNAADVADDIEDNLKKKNNKWELWRELNRFGQVCGS